MDTPDDTDGTTLTVRVNSTHGILLTIAGTTLNPTHDQAIRIADSIEADPDSYGLAGLPDKAEELVKALRAAAGVWRSATMGGFKATGTN